MNFSNWKPTKNKIPYHSVMCPHCGSNNVNFFFEVGYRQDIKNKKVIDIEKIEIKKTKRMVMRIKKPNVMCILGENSLVECKNCRSVLSNINFMLNNKTRNCAASRIRMKHILQIHMRKL